MLPLKAFWAKYQMKKTLTVHILSEVLSHNKTRTPEYHNKQLIFNLKRKSKKNFLQLFSSFYIFKLYQLCFETEGLTQNPS